VTAGVCHIGVVGDHQLGNPTHDAIASSIAHHLATPSAVDVTWLPTDRIPADPTSMLRSFDGLWVAPGSPYRSIDGALAAITYARGAGVPLLGTCGGFQHLVIEYARNVLGFVDAAHAEYDPRASTRFVTPLSCSLAGTTLEVELQAGSLVATAYGSLHAVERYYCNFGLNPEHADELEGGGLSITGHDCDGEARVVELAGHPFFVGTLYVPQTSSTPEIPHPLIGAFVAAAQDRTTGDDR
jgi:CTP synthase (UTP-ammonia lyase)